MVKNEQEHVLSMYNNTFGANGINVGWLYIYPKWFDPDMWLTPFVGSLITNVNFCLSI